MSRMRDDFYNSRRTVGNGNGSDRQHLYVGLWVSDETLRGRELNSCCPVLERSSRT